MNCDLSFTIPHRHSKSALVKSNVPLQLGFVLVIDKAKDMEPGTWKVVEVSDEGLTAVAIRVEEVLC
jgi:hypothetical protein